MQYFIIKADDVEFENAPTTRSSPQPVDSTERVKFLTPDAKFTLKDGLESPKRLIGVLNVDSIGTYSTFEAKRGRGFSGGHTRSGRILDEDDFEDNLENAKLVTVGDEISIEIGPFFQSGEFSLTFKYDAPGLSDPITKILPTEGDHIFLRKDDLFNGTYSDPKKARKYVIKFKNKDRGDSYKAKLKSLIFLDTTALKRELDFFLKEFMASKADTFKDVMKHIDDTFEGHYLDWKQVSDWIQQNYGFRGEDDRE